MDLYDPFIRMLQFGLEPLLLGGDGGAPGATLPVAATILRAIKRSQDAAPEPQTDRMCVHACCRHAFATSVFAVSSQHGLPLTIA